MSQLTAGQHVRIRDQASGRWQKATVTATCEEPRSYLVEAQNGRILRRNRRQLQATPLPRRVHFADETLTAVGGDDTPRAQPTTTGQHDEHTRRADDATQLAYRTRSGRAVKQPDRLDL